MNRKNEHGCWSNRLRGQGRKARNARGEGKQRAMNNKFEEEKLYNDVFYILHLKTMLRCYEYANKPISNSNSNSNS